jgi:hypothetical protein
VARRRKQADLFSTGLLGWPTCLIIRLIIQTIRRDRSGSVWTDDPSNVSRLDPSGADQIDVEHQATDLALGAYALVWETSNLSLRDRNNAKFGLLFGHPMGSAALGRAELARVSEEGLAR